METEDPETSQPHFPIPDEDSGSAYEESDIEEQGSSYEDEEPQVTHSRARSATRRGRSQIRSRKTRESSPYRDNSESDRSKPQDSSTESQRAELRRAATEWATTFQEPESPTDIKSPTRRNQSKRKAGKPPSQIRAKRLKSWYNSEYRRLLNVDIHDAMTRSVDEYQEPLETSQIGSSVWTAEEKDLFFSSLSSLGRDNVREIASRIETKSEVQVQEYVLLLHEGMMVMSNKLLAITDLPAAIDISEECCGVLERAGDALASRQERVEEEVEEDKWDDLWLVNTEVNKRLKRESDRKEVEGILPAVNLFVIGNWLELSRRVFMNSKCEEENWESVAEAEETPAIRATAFEDFHSLAVSVLKRLISATLFCTMSRQRAAGSNVIKHADVNGEDVEAATKILGLKMNSNDFWTQCARRCNLRVFDEEWNSFMSYEEAEESLRENRRGRSRSRSVSRCARSVSRAQSEVYQVDRIHLESHSDDDLGLDHESDYISSPAASDDELTDYLSEGEVTSSKSRKDRLLQRAKAKNDAERAQEAYIEACDNERSHFEEQRLWALLGQTAPFENKYEPTELPNPPKGNFRDDMERGNWRNHLKFRSQWETLETPVPKASFDRNRNKVLKRAKTRAERARFGQDVDSADSEDVESAIESNDDGNEQVEQGVTAVEDDDDEGHFLIQQELGGARIDSDKQGNEAYDNAQDHFEDQDEDQVHDNHVDTKRHEVEHNLHEGNQAEHQYFASASASPISEDTRNFQDAGNYLNIKSENDSSE